ncbi:MAG: flagellar assembly protein FliW [Acidimicrobiales bacterium]
MSIAATVTHEASAPDGDGETAIGREPAPLDEVALTFTRPLIGIERSLHYAVRPLGLSWEPYSALVSLDEPRLAFMVVPPAALFGDYVIEIPDPDVAELDLINADDAVVFVIVRRRGVPSPVANLVAPVVVNRRTRLAAQVVLQDSGYGLMVPVDAGTARPTSVRS